jgi:hypothetical protein
MFVFGIPLSFFLPLLVHVVAGLTTVITGVVAFRVPSSNALAIIPIFAGLDRNAWYARGGTICVFPERATWSH